MTREHSLAATTRERVAELGLNPKRSLGQNFLISESVVERIKVAVLSLEPSQLLEVGPGVGALTDTLVGLGRPLRLIELDRDFAQYWRRRGLDVIEADALKVDWAALPLAPPVVLVSNLPYQISTHLVVDRCMGPSTITGMVLMFQKEVAERLMARPRSKSYGLLSVMTQAHWRVTKVVEAGPRAFWPAPRVASQVLSFSRKPVPLPGLETEFLNFLKAAFAQRRKFLFKNLLARGGVLKLNQDRLAQGFESLQIGPKSRAEELSVEKFIELFQWVRT